MTHALAIGFRVWLLITLNLFRETGEACEPGDHIFLVQQQRSAKRDDVSVSLLLAYSNETFSTSCALHSYDCS